MQTLTGFPGFPYPHVLGKGGGDHSHLVLCPGFRLSHGSGCQVCAQGNLNSFPPHMVIKLVSQG